MESTVKEIRLAELYPVLREVLESDGSVSLTVTGTSMFPTLLEGQDQVRLVQAPERLQKYDVPLYRRTNGQFVLHRILRVEADGTYTCCGDHQYALEQGIRQDQIVALMTEYVHKGKTISVNDRKYLRWVRFWCKSLRFRKLMLNVYYKTAAVKNRLFHKTVKQ